MIIYDLRGQIVKAERRLAVLDERLEMWMQYEKYRPVRQKLDKIKPRKREQYQQEHIHANTYGGIYPEEISALQRGCSALRGPLSDLLKQLSALVEL